MSQIAETNNFRCTGVLLPTPHTPCHLLVWDERNQGRSILFQILHWIKIQVSEVRPAREFAEEIHDYGEHCKYQHVDQAIAKAYP